MSASQPAPSKVLIDGKKTEIWAFPTQDPLVVGYLLPTGTMGEGIASCVDKESAIITGVWAGGMFVTPGVRQLLFNSQDVRGAARDSVRVSFLTAALREKVQPTVEGVMNRFVNEAAANPRVALVNKDKSLSQDELSQMAHKFLEGIEKITDPKEREMHTVKAGVRALMYRFNEVVAGPDGGEVQFVAIKREIIRTQTGAVEGNVVYVRMVDNCVSCPAKPFTVKNKLEPFLKTWMPNSVQAVRVVSDAPGGGKAPV